MKVNRRLSNFRAECVGEVVQSSTPALAVGQKVAFYYGREMGRAFEGSYAEYVLLPNEQIYPIHTDLDWTILAAIPETYYTAFGSLQQLRIAPQDRVCWCMEPTAVWA